MKFTSLLLSVAVGLTCALSGHAEVKLPSGEIDSKYFYDTNGAVLNEGDVLNVYGQKCLVLRSNINEPGLVIALDAIRPVKEDGQIATTWQRIPGTFDNNPRHKEFEIGLKDEDCGLINLFRLQRKVDASFDYSMSDFHAFNACELMGHGWYLPAINELLLLSKVLGIEISPDAKGKEKREVYNAFHNFLKENGIQLRHSYGGFSIYSSTEIKKDEAWAIAGGWQKYKALKFSCDGYNIMPVHLVKAVEGETSTKP